DGNNTELSAAQMLASGFDFDATITLTQGSTLSASARAMLEAGAYTLWTAGTVAQTIVLADHSEGRTYDLGFDAHRSFRPIFLATFWPSLNKVFVRFIGENANTETLQDIAYALTLSVGQAAPQQVHQQAAVQHHGATRWTRTAWLGGAPPTMEIDHGVAAIVATGLAYNFDTTKVVSESAMTTQYDKWSAAEKDIGDKGTWMKAMGAAGGRADIGPYPSWHVRWLFTGDVRMREMALGNSDLAASWPMHFREGRADKSLDRDGKVAGLGHIMSISERPTLAIVSGYDYAYTHEEDRLVPVGAMTSDDWNPDTAHQPDPYSLAYLLTGDFWYLEQGWFWASYSAAHPNGAATIYANGRGPTGAEGGLAGQLRGMAWTLRSRANMAAVSPDAAPEKALLETWIADAIALQEGAWEITDTPTEDTDLWKWGRDYRISADGNPPLNQFARGSAAFAQENYGIDPSVTGEAISNFEQHFMMLALGRARELGYRTDALVAYFGQHYIGALTEPDYNPYLIANGRTPTVDAHGDYFTTWAGLKSGYNADWQARDSFPLTDSEHGYDFLALTAASYVAHLPGGAAAWAFMASEALGAPVLDDNPKWAVVPR
ncbi:MAG: hypothetical protein JRH20_27115, partial [Deltaproteobacteria bacterium]|nr:hypothetical protein [Deltaproteobacteria bacterium]